MKITNNVAISGNQSVSKVNQTLNATGSSFSSLLGEQREQQTRQELEQLMNDIKREGENLVDNKHIEVLISYKKKIKAFVSKAVDFAFEIQDKKGLTRFGRGKILKMVAQIDDAMVDLTEQFLKDERNRVKMLERVGELQGLLYNIYA